MGSPCYFMITLVYNCLFSCMLLRWALPGAEMGLIHPFPMSSSGAHPEWGFSEWKL